MSMTEEMQKAMEAAAKQADVARVAAMRDALEQQRFQAKVSLSFALLFTPEHLRDDKWKEHVAKSFQSWVQVLQFTNEMIAISERVMAAIMLDDEKGIAEAIAELEALEKTRMKHNAEGAN